MQTVRIDGYWPPRLFVVCVRAWVVPFSRWMWGRVRSIWIYTLIRINMDKIIKFPAQSQLCVVRLCKKELRPGNGSTHLLVASGPITQTTLGEALLWLEGWLIDLLWLALPDDLTVFPSVCLSSIPGLACTASPNWWYCWANQKKNSSSLTASFLVPLCQPLIQVVNLYK